MSFCCLIKGTIPKIRVLCFVITNSVLKKKKEKKRKKEKKKDFFFIYIKEYSIFILTFYVFGSCFTTLAVIAIQISFEML